MDDPRPLLRAVATRRSMGALVTLGAMALWTSACGDAASPSDPDGPGEPQALIGVQGDQQQGLPGMPLAEVVTVKVVDAAGRGVPGVPVSFWIGGGGGWITPGDEQLTDADGHASTTWYMGPHVGQNNLLHASSPLGSTGFRAYVTPLLPGKTYRGADGLVEMRMGDLPLILTAPHGGTQTPAAMADRTSGDLDPDPGTAALVADVDAAFAARGGGRPTVLISHLERRKADMEEPLAGATAGDPAAERAWGEYHGFLGAARAHVQDREIRGLIADVHRHGAPDRIQVGYLLTAADLAVADAELGHQEFLLKSSIRDIAHHAAPPFAYILRGEKSLGGILNGLGLSASPSPETPRPEASTYPPGGLTLKRYGSRDGSLVSAVFLNVPAALVETETARTPFAGILVQAFDAYFSAFYRTDLTGG